LIFKQIMPTRCEQLQTELEDLKSRKAEFDLELQKVNVLDPQSEEAKAALLRAKELRTELEQKRDALREKLTPQDLKAAYENPQTEKRENIEINIKEKIEDFKSFYKEHLNLDLTPEQIREINNIFRKRKAEMLKEMETYGYDEVLIIPENLPETEVLNKKLIETIEDFNPPTGKIEPVVKTYQSGNFQQGGGFSGVINTEKPKTRVILTKSSQNTYQSQDPVLEATLNKNIMELTGLSQEEVEKRIKNQEPLPIDFETEIETKQGKKTKMKIQAQGLSLDEYLIFQRYYFDQKHKHLDEKGWTWLPKSLSGSRLVSSYWLLGHRQLHAIALDPGLSLDILGFLGCRPSRSFEN